LRTLLGNIADIFGMRYRHEPTDADRNTERVLFPFKDQHPKVCEELYARVYDKAMMVLGTHDWMIARMREVSDALINQGGPIPTGTTVCDARISRWLAVSSQRF